MQISSMNVICLGRHFRSYHNSIRPQPPVQWHCRRAPITQNPGPGRTLSSKRMKFSISATAHPFSSSTDSSNIAVEHSNEVKVLAKDKNKGDERKFDWFSQWYPAAPEYDLDKRVPHAFTVMGLDLVVWWDKIGQTWQVFDDRCPHRLAPLSEGRIDEDGDLQCSYHGWCFGPSGDCKHVPQAPSDGPAVHTPKKACAHVYPSLQQQGIIWFWPNTDPQFRDIALKEKPPFIPVLSDPEFAYILSMRDIPYGYEVLAENLVDPAHVPYAHHGLVAQTDIGSKPGSSKNDRRAGRPLDFHLLDMDKSGFQGKGENISQNFIAPCTIITDFIFTTPKKGKIGSSTAGAGHKKKKTVFLIFICIPVSPGKSRLIYGFPRNFALWVNMLLPRWLEHIQQNLFLDSDLYLLHLEEHKLQEYGQTNWGKACYVPTASDAFVIAFRKWLEKYAGGGLDWGRKFNGTLPPTPPKEQLMDRYWSHVVKCRSCKGALKAFRVLEIAVQAASIMIIGALAVVKQTVSSSAYFRATPWVCTAVLCYLASRWLSHFIYKSFYFHDYNHALIK